MEDSTVLQESWAYSRPASLVGVELLDAHHCRKQLKVFNIAPSLAMLHSWRGDLLYKGRRYAAGPGDAVCLDADEIHVATPFAMNPGSFNVLIIDPEVLREHVAEQGICSGGPVWRSIIQRASCRLRQKWARIFDLAHESATVMQLQCGLTELIDVFVAELLEQPRVRSSDPRPAPTAAEKIRDYIHDDEPGLDLERLARATGLSRFQVIRAFKQRYGLPPQTYQLRLKIARAQRMLRQGQSPADVALGCGFVDQSHLGRHFKRFVGMTPGEYARLSGTRGKDHSMRWEPRVGLWVQPFWRNRCRDAFSI